MGTASAQIAFTIGLLSMLFGWIFGLGSLVGYKHSGPSIYVSLVLFLIGLAIVATLLTAWRKETKKDIERIRRELLENKPPVPSPRRPLPTADEYLQGVSENVSPEAAERIRKS